MRPLARYTLTGAAVGLVVAIAWPALVKYQQRSDVDEAQQILTELEREAARRHPGTPRSRAMAVEARRMAEERLDDSGDPEERAYRAASMYMGFYLVNVRERRDYCAGLGVDIGPFVEAFIIAHVKETARAREILARHGTAEDHLQQDLRDALRDSVETDMRDLAKVNGISTAQACQMVADRATKLARQIHFARVQPDVHAALTGAQ